MVCVGVVVGGGGGVEGIVVVSVVVVIDGGGGGLPQPASRAIAPTIAALASNRMPDT